jgi:hypothetical protein
VKPRKQPSGATRAAATGITASEPVAGDPFDAIVDEGIALALATARAKAAAESAVGPRERGQAAQELREQRTAEFEKQRESRERTTAEARAKAAKKAGAAYLAQVEAHLRTLPTEELYAVEEAPWFRALNQARQEAVTGVIEKVREAVWGLGGSVDDDYVPAEFEDASFAEPEPELDSGGYIHHSDGRVTVDDTDDEYVFDPTQQEGW